MSLPLWERGLKSGKSPKVLSSGPVAPFVGAWVEIDGNVIIINPFISSLPLWERGLKSLLCIVIYNDWWSLPLWERGLKLAMFETRDYGITVAPFVGAWVEISLAQTLANYVTSRSLCGSVG